MSVLEWDKKGEHYWEVGVKKGVLYPQNSDGTYGAGVAWNGLISVSNNPDGADPNELWADNIKYAVLRSAETLSLTIEAYTYPKEFEACDGMAEVSSIEGMILGQQPRQSFGFCYRTEVGNDTQTNGDDHYKIHVVYGCVAQPSDKDYETINDSPDAMTFSWDVDTLPENVAGMEPVSEIIFDSSRMDAQKLAKLEGILYGTANSEPTLLSPDALIAEITKP